MDLRGIELIGCIFFAAALYSSVGHAGASGYLAAMALFAVPQATMKPSALVLNIFVAIIGSIRFVAARAFSFGLFLPLALGSVPAAFFGGRLKIPEQYYRILIAIALLFAAFRLAFGVLFKDRIRYQEPSFLLLIIVGIAIGFLSGLTGVGGGIYLTPIILLSGWAPAKTAAGVSVTFILVNSISGLLGQASKKLELPPEIWYWIAAAILGGLLGSYVGVSKFGETGLRRMLAVVLVIAAAKLLVS